MQEYQQMQIDNMLERIRLEDEKRAVELRAAGWQWIKTAERSVTFTFGVVTFERKVWRKGKEWCYPVDEYLGLTPNIRYSQEMIYQISELSTDLSCRKGSKTIENLKNVFVNKNVVCRVKKYIRKLHKEKKELSYYKDDDLIKKVKVKKLYLEGDGVMIKTINGEEVVNTDLAHYLIHEGVEKEYGKKRNKAVAKYETISRSHEEARDEAIDYIHNHYDLTPDTLLITNSDMGRGYSAESFEEIAAMFKCRHEHFWDAYHLNIKIKEAFKKIQDKDTSYCKKNRLFTAIQNHDLSDTELILETAEGCIFNDDDLEIFSKFANKLIRNFKYTKPAELRGLSREGIGIMEAQHVKITDRMKHRGMYWSLDGAETMAKMIIEKSAGTLRDLFFGDWRQEYAKMKALPTSAAAYLKKSHIASTVNKGTIRSKTVSKHFS
ncbi:ISLre2 family transposase [Pseudolactococcus yaeyamensis]